MKRTLVAALLFTVLCPVLKADSIAIAYLTFSGHPGDFPERYDGESWITNLTDQTLAWNAFTFYTPADSVFYSFPTTRTWIGGQTERALSWGNWAAGYHAILFGTVAATFTKDGYLYEALSNWQSPSIYVEQTGSAYLYVDAKLLQKVPEAGTFMLLSLSLLGIGVLRSKRIKD